MISENLISLNKELPSEVKLVAVSKFHPLEAILEARKAGQLLFGESRPQELEKKALTLKEMGKEYADVSFHFIGHLQTNKLKMVLPYVDMVESVDSRHLLNEIQKWGKSNSKVMDVLLELHLGAEVTKQGFTEEEILDLLFDICNSTAYTNIRVCGLMGMATNTTDEDAIDADFARIEDFFEYLKDLFDELVDFKELSIGMSADWKIALSHKATIVRIGTAIFGQRQ